MKQLYVTFIELNRGKHDRAYIGGFYFDEVKIKEGLLWDCSSNELTGFVDTDEGQGESIDAEKMIATCVLQFSFKSLLWSFSFPCAYFLTRARTSTDIHAMLWEGMAALHDYGFQL